MPIRLVDRHPLRIGHIASTQAHVTSAMVGTLAVAPGRTGTIGVTMASVTSAMSGTRTVPVGRTGTIAATLAVVAPNLDGSTSAKVLNPGHYISFASYINLKTSMSDVLANPTAFTQAQRNTANQLVDVLTAPGVKGAWIPFEWKNVEITETDSPPNGGVFTWGPLDDNITALTTINKRAIFKLTDRSFNLSNPMPLYFPAQYSIFYEDIPRNVEGYIAKRWDSYVYTRIIRILKAIATKYNTSLYFEGACTAESAIGTFDHGANQYSPEAYRTALIEIANQSKVFFTKSKLFFYLNFLSGGQANVLANDYRVDVIDAIQGGGNIALGGPDVTADDSGHARGVNQIYIYAEQTYPNLTKCSHAQFNDFKQVKDNTFRIDFFNDTGAYAPDILRDENLNGDFDLHPSGELGHFWKPIETFTYARENFGTNYMFWHNKTFGSSMDNDTPPTREYRIDEVLPVIAANQVL